MPSQKLDVYRYVEIDTQRGSRTFFIRREGETDYKRWEVFDHTLNPPDEPGGNTEDKPKEETNE